MIIAGDVGGTKTLLALYEPGNNTPVTSKSYRSDAYPHLEDIVQTFINENQAKVDRAVFGVPGPVLDGEAHITNLPWFIIEKEMVSKTSVDRVKLLNDLEATAYGVLNLGPNDLAVLNDQPARSGNKVIIAPGTGLGESILFHHEGNYYASATEGGHTDFAPRSLFEIELLRYMLGKFEHVSYERMCSGIGIPHIYDYLALNKYSHENPQIEEQLRNAADRTPIIVKAALNFESDMCMETLDVFVKILGAEAGNMALKTLARGGVYLGGGIPPKIIDKLRDGTFMATFGDKGRFADVVSHIPVYVIMNEQTALLGAAHYAINLM